LVKSQYNSLYFLIGGLLFIGLGIFVFRRWKKSNNNNLNHQQLTISDGSEYHFKPIELDLIDKIYQVSLTGKSYSVEEVNNSLGLTKKTLEIQKKIRTETLNRINHRFKMKFETDEDLIERIRSEEDRRFYRYIIREENGKKALNS
jgi:LPXTG-motif cell wall-anchored protein